MMFYAQLVLSAGVAEVGRGLEPHHGFGFITRDSLTHFVHHSEVELSEPVALFSGFEVPMGGLDVILGGAFVGEFDSKAELSIGFATVGSDFERLRGFRN